MVMWMPYFSSSPTVQQQHYAQLMHSLTSVSINSKDPVVNLPHKALFTSHKALIQKDTSDADTHLRDADKYGPSFL